MEQVRAWFDQAGLAIEEEVTEEEGTGEGYVHLLAKKKESINRLDLGQFLGQDAPLGQRNWRTTS
jgi:hypothetical protein